MSVDTYRNPVRRMVNGEVIHILLHKVYLDVFLHFIDEKTGDQE